jgi:hypothetical protein
MAMYFNDLMPWHVKDHPSWCNPHELAGTIDIPVDPVTAMSLFGLTAEQLGFSEAEQALFNLLKR